MQWTKPDFQEITLGMEVTAYVNTDEAVVGGQRPVARKDSVPPRQETTDDLRRTTTDH